MTDLPSTWPIEPRDHSLHGYTLRTSLQVGTRGRSGQKVHVIAVSEIIGVDHPEEAKPRTLDAQWLAEQKRAHPRPVYFSITAWCNANGQFTAQALGDTQWERVTCATCRKQLARAQTTAQQHES